MKKMTFKAGSLKILMFILALLSVSIWFIDPLTLNSKGRAALLFSMILTPVSIMFFICSFRWKIVIDKELIKISYPGVSIWKMKCIGLNEIKNISFQKTYGTQEINLCLLDEKVISIKPIGFWKKKELMEYFKMLSTKIETKSSTKKGLDSSSV